MNRLLLLPILGVAALGAAPATLGQSTRLQLELPVACQIGKTCFVQQYVDHDPGPAARDYRCGPKVYDGHSGTDFRVPSRAAMTAGVGVRAAAGGVVKSVRDGQPDHRGAPGDIAAVKAGGLECGNGVVITHVGGYETQYCHMKQGSVSVRPGQSVAAGAALGQVGHSGEAAFPHLHLSLRANGERIDPFSPAASNRCGQSGPSLWAPSAQAALIYRSPEVINAGFAGGPVTPDSVEAGGIGPASATGPALVSYVRAIGLEAGDVQLLRVTAPDGKLFAETTGPELKIPRAQQMLFTGKRNSAGRFTPGVYRARYTVTRGGKLVLEHVAEARL
jgi:hypothetical protein